MKRTEYILETRPCCDGTKVEWRVKFLPRYYLPQEIGHGAADDREAALKAADEVIARDKAQRAYENSWVGEHRG